MDPTVTELLCPRCRVGLFEGRRGALALHACGGCGGVWLDNDASQRIVQRHEPFAVEASKIAARRAQRIGVAPGPVPCPVCAETLAATIVPPSAIQLDVCAAHGTWFDRSELDVIIETVLHRAPPPAPPPVTMPVQLDDRDRALDDELRRAFDEEQRRRSVEVVGTVVGGLFEALFDSAKR